MLDGREVAGGHRRGGEEAAEAEKEEIGMGLGGVGAGSRLGRRLGACRGRTLGGGEAAGRAALGCAGRERGQYQPVQASASRCSPVRAAVHLRTCAGCARLGRTRGSHLAIAREIKLADQGTRPCKDARGRPTVGTNVTLR
ncbi:hypothetical protein BS50DRAFT_265303 [Corynespora cassiicola Philippines]|uniref:Uncharacterized protein n=1 Tax=Corynespora cassiicola Philippines TaxID=1448308 RepID=A0A2T2NZ40_CORCC|nr:hypothetical protein BS50DRAFT_265303 [Corynespora cassiicola Philippines]